MDIHYTENTFRRLSDMPWADNPRAREAGYHFRALSYRATPENILGFACTTFELAQHEPDAQARMKLLIMFDRKMLEFQKANPDTSLAPIYESLMLNIERSAKNWDAVLINLGLDMAIRESNPSSQNYFDWVVQRLIPNRQDFPGGQEPRRILTTVKRLGDVAKIHKSLITTNYIEMCCSFIDWPFLDFPVMERYEQPHEALRRQRISTNVVDTNKAIESMHTFAGNNLTVVIRWAKIQLDKMSAITLFSDAAVKSLHQANTAKNKGNINALIVPSMLQDIRALRRPVTRTEVKLLTHSPTEIRKDLR